MHTKIIVLKSELDRITHEKRRLEIELEQEKSIFNSRADTPTALESKIRVTKGDINKIDIDIEKLKNERNKIDVQIKKLDDKKSAIQKEEANFTESLRMAKQKGADLDKKTKNYTVRISNFEGDINSMKKQIKDLERKLTMNKTELDLVNK